MKGEQTNGAPELPGRLLPDVEAGDEGGLSGQSLGVLAKAVVWERSGCSVGGVAVMGKHAGHEMGASWVQRMVLGP